MSKTKIENRKTFLTEILPFTKSQFKFADLKLKTNYKVIKFIKADKILIFGSMVEEILNHKYILIIIYMYCI